MSGLLCIQPSLRQLALNVDRNPKLAIPGLQLRPKHSDLAQVPKRTRSEF